MSRVSDAEVMLVILSLASSRVATSYLVVRSQLLDTKLKHTVLEYVNEKKKLTRS
jgi:hypothetical protein